MKSIDGRQAALVGSMWLLAACGGGSGAGNHAPSPPPDTTPPDTIVHGAPPAFLRKNEVEFTVSSTEGGNCFQLKINSGGWLDIGPLVKVMNLFDGVNTLTIRACDSYGNFDPTPAVVTWTQDTKLPIVRIVFPTPVSYSDGAELHVRGTAQDANGVTNLRVNGVAATTTDAFAHWAAVLPLAAGDNTLVVEATDGAGNVSPSAAQARVSNQGAVMNAPDAYSLR